MQNEQVFFPVGSEIPVNLLEMQFIYSLTASVCRLQLATAPKKLIQHNQLWKNTLFVFCCCLCANNESISTTGPLKKRKMLFLLCHNIKTDIIMHIVVYLFEKVGVFCCLFWHCHGIYLSLENLGMPWYKMTVKANLCELQQLGSPKMNDWECIESSKNGLFLSFWVYFSVVFLQTTSLRAHFHWNF